MHYFTIVRSANDPLQWVVTPTTIQDWKGRYLWGNQAEAQAAAEEMNRGEWWFGYTVGRKAA